MQFKQFMILALFLLGPIGLSQSAITDPNPTETTQEAEIHLMNGYRLCKVSDLLPKAALRDLDNLGELEPSQMVLLNLQDGKLGEPGPENLVFGKLIRIAAATYNLALIRVDDIEELFEFPAPPLELVDRYVRAKFIWSAGLTDNLKGKFRVARPMQLVMNGILELYLKAAHPGKYDDNDPRSRSGRILLQEEPQIDLYYEVIKGEPVYTFRRVMDKYVWAANPGGAHFTNWADRMQALGYDIANDQINNASLAVYEYKICPPSKSERLTSTLLNQLNRAPKTYVGLLALTFDWLALKGINYGLANYPRTKTIMQSCLALYAASHAAALLYPRLNWRF